MIIAFSPSQASKMAGLPIETLRKWVTQGFSIPSVQKGVGKGTINLYDFRDIVILRIAAELREAGVSMKVLERMRDYLRERRPIDADEISHPCDLVITRDSVFESDPLTPGEGSQASYRIVVVLSQIIADLQQQVRMLESRQLKLGQQAAA